jgi:allose kinase
VGAAAAGAGAGAAAAAGGNLLGCYIGTGFGSAVMVNGRLLKGRHGSAMEAGHIPFFHNGRVCGCGLTGCAETYASGRAAREMLDAHYPGLSFAQAFHEHADEAPVSDLVDAIAVTVATLVNLFDPHMVFLGGGVLSEEFPKDRLVEAILRHTLAPYPREGLDIRFSSHDAFSGVVGAALCAEGQGA